MTTYIFDAIIGPAQDGTIMYFDSSISNYALDDSNDAYAYGLCIPKTGIITDIGFLIYQLAGTPPEYNSGLTTLAATTGLPTQTPYGGSVITPFTPVTSGWSWITLNTPASGIMGEYATVHVFPGGVAPSIANHLKIARNNIHYSYGIWGFPRSFQFTTVWSDFDWGYSYFAIRYDNGDIYGYPVRIPLFIPIANNTTPDELGVKFTLPFDVNCTGPCITFYTANADVAMDIILYDSNDSILRSISYSDLDLIRTDNADGMRTDIKWSSAIALTKDTVYRLVVKPTAATVINLCGLRFNDDNAKDNNMFNYLSRWDRTERTDGSTWIDTSTDIIGFGIIIDSISVDTGAAPAAGNIGGSYAYVG